MKINRPPDPKLRPSSAKQPSAASAQPATPAKAGWAAKPSATARPLQAAAPAPLSTTAFDSPSFDAELDQTTHSRSVAGNQATMLFDGVNSFAERNKLIAGAKDSIHLQTFIFNSDDTGWALARLLASKAQEGVQVRVIIDAVGSNRADPKMLQLMKDAGVQLQTYGSVKSHLLTANERWHEKHLVIDGKTSIEGGMNIANEYALGGSGKLVFSRGKTGTEAWRDTDVKLEGPAVHDTQAAFLKNWEAAGGTLTDAERARALPPITPSADGSKVRVVQHRPNQDGDQNVHALYLKAIDTAQKSITIENAYFLPPKELHDALLKAARRGVEVKVMTNSRESNDTGAVSDAGRYFYDDLIAAGVQIYEKQGGTLHSKTATFDGAFSLVGSANLNGRSDGLDSEDVLAIKDPTVAAQLNSRFTSGLAQTHQVTGDELKHESFLTNLKQWAASTLAWTM